MNKNYIILNNKVNQKDSKGNYINLHLDKKAVKEYFLNNVNQNTVFFHTLKEKLDYLVDEGYYDKSVLDRYSFKEIKSIFKIAYDKKFRFRSFLGAYMFYDRYALKTKDKDRILERYEDRIAMISLTIANNYEEAKEFLDILIKRQLCPATPIYMNSGKLRAGNLVSCFILNVEDNLESIGYAINSSMKLSQMGGGVGLNLTNIRARGDSIKGISNASSGVLPPSKVFEDVFSYVNQLGTRNGSGAVYLSIFHNDIEEFLNSKKVNADEKLRLKTLSTGVIIPDKFMELLKNNNENYYYTFYPKNVLDVTGIELGDMDMSVWYEKLSLNKDIKKTKRNKLFILQEIIKSQSESGYPFIMFNDTCNRENNLKNIGKIQCMNICTEISILSTKNKFSDSPYLINNEFGNDVNCVLSSLDLVNLFECTNTLEREKIIDTSIKFLSNVSDKSEIKEVPSVLNGNKNFHSIGLGAMNLHGLFVKLGIEYESEEAKDLSNLLFMYIRYNALKSSMNIAKNRKETFKDFEKSDYANGSALEKYINGRIELLPVTDKIKEIVEKFNFNLPSKEDWLKLIEDIKQYGLYNAYLLAIAPNQSSAYIMESTPSVAPISNVVEVRDYGYSQAVYPMPYLTNENKHLYKSSYDVDQLKMIDLMSVIQQHIDQAISIVINVNGNTNLKDRIKIIGHAWNKGIKSLYYWRTRKQSIMDNKEPICEACSV